MIQRSDRRNCRIANSVAGSDPVRGAVITIDTSTTFSITRAAYKMGAPRNEILISNPPRLGGVRSLRRLLNCGSWTIVPRNLYFVRSLATNVTCNNCHLNECCKAPSCTACCWPPLWQWQM